MKKMRLFFIMVLLLFGMCSGYSRAASSDQEIARLVQVLINPSATVETKGNACEQLMEYGPQAQAAVPALIDQLQNKDEILRDYAITTLTKIGPGAKPAVPALQRVATRDPSPDIRELACDAIKKLAQTNPANTNRQSKSAMTAPPPKPLVPVKQNPAANNRPLGKLNRPPLQLQPGRYFRWACPPGWRASETMSGVTLYSPDNKQAALFALLMRSAGQNSPDRFLIGMMQRVPQYSNIRVVAAKVMPSQASGIPGTSWQVMEITVQFAVDGLPVTGLLTCGVNNYYGMYDAVIVGYYATPDLWPQARLYLPEVSRSITITNPGQVAGNDQLIPAKNNPLDNAGLIESWRQKGLSEDRISQATREGTSGYTRQKDSQGNVYEMPLESYDGAAGGYRNPYNPSEILRHANPGE